MATTERHAREILQKQYDRQNEFVKNAYDRIAFFVPKGMKESIKETAKNKGYTSVNSYINALIAADMASTAEPPTADHAPDDSRATDSRSCPGCIVIRIVTSAYHGTFFMLKNTLCNMHKKRLKIGVFIYNQYCMIILHNTFKSGIL